MKLTEDQLAELADIGSSYTYTGAKNQIYISRGGVLEILKKYEKMSSKGSSTQ